MKTYLNNLISEKANISMTTPIEVEGASGTNFMNVGVIVEHILIAPKTEQQAIKNVLVRIDFDNGDVLDFFKHLAKAIAK
tara:strand:+ start:302 stop:541 length:240 start_codon:yes stop_codon:yes gene_type:complete